ncbi:PIN domain-containing protein [Methanobrevibacter curvatus]|uniref:tRNA(FMet)-specific endonuclease VapC n=1 Tax=Methanobrevibacter curvatus TaxID=49547 RepID=A0A162FI17_9EURY|nr:ribonuclease VapC [Methanobrevibacter curvatus]KZX10270.1 tRNA(fMet)-specific endonuclease VapC [Methanobrevibacter curvatus]
MKENNNSKNNYFIIDASGFINGFKPYGKNNFSVSEITEEIKDLKSKLSLEEAISSGNLKISDVSDESLNELKKIIEKSGDTLRLSNPDIKLLALALELKDKNPIVVTDDYTIQNTLKILDIQFKPIINKGIDTIYNWKKVCMGCKKEYLNSYKFDDCEICGSKVYKKRIKL